MNFLQTNERFKNLGQNTEFKQLLEDMENKLTQIEKLKKEEKQQWNEEIVKNQITESIPFNQAESGFAIFYRSRRAESSLCCFCSESTNLQNP
jgi:phage shock protein A